jgi:hypothetical protein
VKESARKVRTNELIGIRDSWFAYPDILDGKTGETFHLAAIHFSRATYEIKINRRNERRNAGETVVTSQKHSGPQPTGAELLSGKRKPWLPSGAVFPEAHIAYRLVAIVHSVKIISLNVCI